jgi:hypothetical protein
MSEPAVKSKEHAKLRDRGRFAIPPDLQPFLGRSADVKEYVILPTIRKFHESGAQIRCIVGPVGSGKTSAATWELCYYLPQFLLEEYGMRDTRWVVVRNTYRELRDTTMRTIFDWFPWGTHRKQENIYLLRYPEGYTVEILFRSCDNPDDVKKFKSLEITGYWVDESIEVADEIKRMLKNRIGRYPQKCPVRFGIETTNPPDVEHSTYTDFDWSATGHPGPISDRKPLPNHAGFWQPPGENNANLREGYYDDLRNDYRDQPDWIETYINGHPGVIVQGKLVYNNFKKSAHVADEPLVWSGGTLYRGWDHSGNTPACIVIQVPTARQAQVLREFHTDKMGIEDFAKSVQTSCNLAFPDAKYQDWGDPAGDNRFSKKGGGFTSNTKLVREATGIRVRPSDQNWTARKESVERQLGHVDGLLIDPSCTRLINGFIGGYHYKEIGVTGQYQDRPEKNKYSHVHDALQYVMQKIFGNTMDITEEESTKRRMAQGAKDTDDPIRSFIKGD